MGRVPNPSRLQQSSGVEGSRAPMKENQEVHTQRMLVKTHSSEEELETLGIIQCVFDEIQKFCYFLVC